ncbi:NAD(P)(+)--arginine ADP-ribosyltransferase 1-like [Symphorus nematophorus]
MAVWAAVLITYGVPTGTAMHSTKLGLNHVVQLDMASNSVDDMYDGCKDKMKSKVENEYLPNEKNSNSKFKQAWEAAERRFKKRSVKLGKEQLDFNNAVRNQKSEYNTTFRYHALHFFLTDAIQTLKAHKKKVCLTGIRGVDVYLSQDILYEEIRFGSFTSSTMAGYKVAKKFGDKSCFKIKTCFGADISLYSKYDNEAEVLIPPYEVFNVTEIIKRSEQKNLPCEVVYQVESTGKTLSNLNCSLFL